MDIGKVNETLKFLIKHFGYDHKISELDIKSIVIKLNEISQEMEINTVHKVYFPFKMDSKLERKDNLNNILTIILPRISKACQRTKNISNPCFRGEAIKNMAGYIKLLATIHANETHSNTQSSLYFAYFCYALNLSKVFTDENFKIECPQDYFFNWKSMTTCESIGEFEIIMDTAFYFYKNTILNSKLFKKTLEIFLENNSDKLKSYKKTFSNCVKENIRWLSTPIIDGMVGFDSNIFLSTNLFCLREDDSINIAVIIQVIMHELSHLAYREEKDNFLELSGSSIAEKLEKEAEGETVYIDDCFYETGNKFDNLLYGGFYNWNNKQIALRFLDKDAWDKEEALFSDLGLQQQISHNLYLSGLKVNTRKSKFR